MFRRTDYTISIGGIIILDEQILAQPSIPKWWLPVGESESILHLKMFECAMAGCDTIFLGIPWHLIDFYNSQMKTYKYVEDPVILTEDYLKHAMPDESHRRIRVFTIPLTVPSDRWANFSEAYSILSCIKFVSEITSRKDSELFGYDKYYICFSDVIYDLDSIMHTRIIAQRDRITSLLLEDKENHTITSNKKYPFYISHVDYLSLREGFDSASMRKLFDEKNPKLVGDAKITRIKPSKVSQIEFSDIFGKMENNFITYSLNGTVVNIEKMTDYVKIFSSDALNYYNNYPRKKFHIERN